MAFMHALWDKMHAFRPGWEKVRKLKSAYVDIDVFRMIKYSFEELVYVAGKRSVTFLPGRLRPDYEWLIPLL